MALFTRPGFYSERSEAAKKTCHKRCRRDPATALPIQERTR
ncbi:MAG: hypothetical protein AAF950_17230 [Pseudomonadota bacterium]